MNSRKRNENLAQEWSRQWCWRFSLGASKFERRAELCASSCLSVSILLRRFPYSPRPATGCSSPSPTRLQSARLRRSRTARPSRRLPLRSPSAVPPGRLPRADSVDHAEDASGGRAADVHYLPAQRCHAESWSNHNLRLANLLLTCRYFTIY